MKLLRVIYYLFILTVSTSDSNAQVIKSIALKGGMSFGEQDWHYKQFSISDKPQTLRGVFTGLEAEFIRGKFLSLSGEFSYCEKGHQLWIPVTNDVGDLTGESLVKYHFNYLSFSPQVSTHYQMKNWTSYMSIGPRIDHVLWSFVASEWDNYKQKGTIKSQNTLFGMNATTGIEYTFDNKGIFAEAKYLHDFTRAIDTTYLSVRNRAYIVCLGIRYNFLKAE